MADPLTKAELRACALANDVEKKKDEFTTQLLSLLQTFDRSLLVQTQ